MHCLCVTHGSLSAGPGCKLSLGFSVAGSEAASSSDDVGAFLSQCQGCAQDTGTPACPQAKKAAQKGTKKIEKQGNKLAGLFGGK